MQQALQQLTGAQGQPTWATEEQAVGHKPWELVTEATNDRHKAAADELQTTVRMREF